MTAGVRQGSGLLWFYKANVYNVLAFILSQLAYAIIHIYSNADAGFWDLFKHVFTEFGVAMQMFILPSCLVIALVAWIATRVEETADFRGPAAFLLSLWPTFLSLVTFETSGLFIAAAYFLCGCLLPVPPFLGSRVRSHHSQES